METTFTIQELIDAINKHRYKEENVEYTIEQLLLNIEEEEFDGDIINIEKITLIQCIGLLSNHSTYLRILATKSLLHQTHYSVSDFSKLNNINLDYGEIIVLSKYCQKISDTENKTVKSKTNKNNKNVKMFDANILKKVLKIK